MSNNTYKYLDFSISNSCYMDIIIVDLFSFSMQKFGHIKHQYENKAVQMLFLTL